MEPFGSLVCLMIGSAGTLLALWLVLRRGWRQLAVAAAYQEVARQLGLWADTRGISVQGHLGDRRIWIGEVLLRHGPARRTVTWGVVEFSRPLGLGLHVGRRGRTWLGHSDAVTLADPVLAKRYRVAGDDPQAIATLLRPEVQAALARFVGDWPRLVVSDEYLRVDLPEPEASAGHLRLLVDGLVELATRLEEARSALPAPPGALDLVAPWQRAAPDLGLSCDERYPALHGSHEGRKVLFVARRTPEGWSTEFTLWLQPHEASGLRIFPQRDPDGYWSVGQDIQVGDAAFDSAFVVKAWDPLWVAEVFGPELRNALLSLARDAELAFDDRVLRVQGLPADPSAFAVRLRLATAVANLLAW